MKTNDFLLALGLASSTAAASATAWAQPASDAAQEPAATTAVAPKPPAQASPATPVPAAPAAVRDDGTTGAPVALKPPQEPPADAEATLAGAEEASSPEQATLAGAEEASSPEQATPPVESEPSSPTAASTTERVVPALAGPEAPLSARYFVGLAVDTGWNTDPAWDFFSDNDLEQRFGLVVLWDALSLGRAVLAAEVQLLRGVAEDGLNASLVSDATLQQTDLGLGAQLRYPVTNWLAPYARLAGGAAFIDTELAFAGTQVDDERTNYYGTASVGLALFTPKQRISHSRPRANSLGGVLMADAGYRFDQDLQFELPQQAVSGPDDGGTQLVRAPAVALGDLKRSGGYLRISLLANF